MSSKIVLPSGANIRSQGATQTLRNQWRSQRLGQYTQKVSQVRNIDGKLVDMDPHVYQSSNMKGLAISFSKNSNVYKAQHPGGLATFEGFKIPAAV
jgi:hypothetical protein